jgi:FG-GAP-like repeat
MCLGLAASILAVASGGLRKPSLIEIFETVASLSKMPGTFRAPVASFNVIGSVVYLAAGDFNKDGKLDLAVMGTVGVQIALSNGDGTFHGSLSLGPPGAFGVVGQLAVADLNGDGNLDLVYTAS